MKPIYEAKGPTARLLMPFCFDLRYYFYGFKTSD